MLSNHHPVHRACVPAALACAFWLLGSAEWLEIGDNAFTQQAQLLVLDARDPAAIAEIAVHALEGRVVSSASSATFLDRIDLSVPRPRSADERWGRSTAAPRCSTERRRYRGRAALSDALDDDKVNLEPLGGGYRGTCVFRPALDLVADPLVAAAVATRWRRVARQMPASLQTTRLKTAESLRCGEPTRVRV